MNKLILIVTYCLIKMCCIQASECITHELSDVFADSETSQISVKITDCDSVTRDKEISRQTTKHLTSYPIDDKLHLLFGTLNIAGGMLAYRQYHSLNPVPDEETALLFNLVPVFLGLAAGIINVYSIKHDHNLVPKILAKGLLSLTLGSMTVAGSFTYPGYVRPLLTGGAMFMTVTGGYFGAKSTIIKNCLRWR